MKFAKELDQDLVPEWRLKYLDYKGGKKCIKDISRALGRINQTPRVRAKLQQKTPFNLFHAIDDAGIRTPPEARESLAEQLLRAHVTSPTRRNTKPGSDGHDGADDAKTVDSQHGSGRETVGNKQDTRQEPSTGRQTTRSEQKRSVNERSPLRGDDQPAGVEGFYGSMLSTDPIKSAPVGPPSLELPDPALSPNDPLLRSRQSIERNGEQPQVRRAASVAGDAYEVGRTHTPSKASVGKLPKTRSMFHPRRTFSTPYGGTNTRPPFFERLFSHHKTHASGNPDIPLEAYRDFDTAQARFFNYLDTELDKIESFYKLKEQESEDRFHKLHNQLRIMRDRRVHELLESQQRKAHLEQHRDHEESEANGHKERPPLLPINSITFEAGRDLLRPFEHAVGLGAHVGKNSQALHDMVTAKQRGEDPHDTHNQGWRDYSRQPVIEDVPYRVAKRKLKVALQEHYRGLELLKSYALMNRTAFRKINKKYDKAVMARPPYRFMSERVNNAWFVTSERLERLIVECEDLYARYFERGNHKVAVSKLRSKTSGGNHSATVFRNGIMLTAGVILATQGAIDGFFINTDPSDLVKGQWASYLLQLYGGYALAILLFLGFAIDCRQWTKSRINYVFIFEFDTRHNLDWRQLAELPCLFTLLLGLTMFLNFSPTSPPVFFVWWPVVLLGLTLGIMFFPARSFYWRSRGWLLYSLWRLAFAGIYAVEFRDFFLGDMFCSLTYSMQNIEVFFCLYAQGWSDPEMCNSSHSRLLGFFSALPGIWRALQCIRRYHDTRNVFPHLVNCGKYLCTILFYMCLSLHRVDGRTEYYVLFVLFGCLNSIYTSVWDLVMDWSLFNPYAPNPFLRTDLGYKSIRFYYTAMVIDPILRFNWLLYVALPLDLQHSALLSFIISISEVSRRSMWTLLRVENEHCTNVGRFRAWRDVPLPYELDETASEEGSSKPPTRDPTSGSSAQLSKPAVAASFHATPATAPDAHGSQTPHTLRPTASGVSQPSPGLLRRRQTLPPGLVEAGSGGDSPRRLNRVGTMLATAHAQDFERRNKPGGTFVGMDGTPEPNEPHGKPDGGVESSDDEEEEPHAESARLLDQREQEVESARLNHRLYAPESTRFAGEQPESAGVRHREREPFTARPIETEREDRRPRPIEVPQPEEVEEAEGEQARSHARGKAVQK